MMPDCVSVVDFIINTQGIQLKLLFSSIKVKISIISAKKSHQYSELSLYHMIDIFLSPEQDLYYSAIEARPKQVHPENLRICESLLR